MKIGYLIDRIISLFNFLKYEKRKNGKKTKTAVDKIGSWFSQANINEIGRKINGMTRKIIQLDFLLYVPLISKYSFFKSLTIINEIIERNDKIYANKCNENLKINISLSLFNEESKDIMPPIA